MTALLLGTLAGFLASLALIWLGYRALGWWREVPLDGDDFRFTPREWDQIYAAHDLGPGVTSPAPGPSDHRRLNGDT